MSSENKTTESSNIVTVTATCNYQMDKSTGQILSVNLVLPMTTPQEKVKNLDLIDYAAKGNLEKVKELLEKNCDVDVVDSWGDTPLHEAVRNNHKEIAKLLLEYKSDPNRKNRCGSTPLHRAVVNHYTEIAKLLLMNNAKINTQDSYGDTPLHDAVNKNHIEIIELLLHHGADVTIKNKKNETALDFAKEKNLTKIIKLLENHINKNTETPATQEPVAQSAKVEPDKTDIIKVKFSHKGENFEYEGPESQFAKYYNTIKSGL